LQKGANKGYLTAKYKAIANKALDGLTEKLIKVSADSEVTITQARAVGPGGKPL
jgi:unsaturated rhamnogalacturonyl hydrolase